MDSLWWQSLILPPALSKGGIGPSISPEIEGPAHDLKSPVLRPFSFEESETNQGIVSLLSQAAAWLPR
jgi:hypothetical protein